MLYSIDKIIREYSGYFSKLSLPCYFEHGWTYLSEPLATDLMTNKKLMLVWNKRRKDAWLKKSAVHVEIMGMPFLHYRRMHKIEKKADASGTVAFPAHGTDRVRVELDIDKYCIELKSLPQDYHPVKICLHYDDILRNKHQAYKEHGFEIITVGDKHDPNYVDSFYKIITSFKFSTSNVLGSYTFYSVDLGIPFFLIGDNPIFYNEGNDPNIPQILSLLDYEIYQYLYNLFSTGPIQNISHEQSEAVLIESGYNDTIDPQELRKMLFKYFFRYEMFRVIIEKVYNYICLSRKIIKTKSYLLIHRLTYASKIFTHMRIEEKIALHRLLKLENRNLNCVEIGSYLGASSYFIANAITKCSKLICIDTWGNDNMKYSEEDLDGEKRETYDEFIKNTGKYKEKIIMLRKWSTDALEEVKQIIPQIDFLFIDGDHSYEGVKKDWDLYSPLLLPGSLIAFHDSGWAEGVQRVINEEVLPRTTEIKRLSNLRIFSIKCLS